MMRWIALCFPVLLAACLSGAPTAEPRILVIGDSMLAAHKLSDRAVAGTVSSTLGEPVVDRSVIGARLAYQLPVSGALGFNIAQQYRGGKFDWVIANGGGNDLWLGCGCHACVRKMDRLISKDLTGGAIPDLLRRLEDSDAKVLWLGYLRSPGVNSPIESCADVGRELEARITALAARRAGFHYLSMKDLVPHGDRSYHGIDMIHPSIKGSAAIGARAVAYIQRVDPTR